MLTITDQEFLRLVDYVQKNFGIDLSKKKQLITSRLSNSIVTAGFADFSAYVNHIIQTSDKNSIELMLNKLTTNYTYFLREANHFDFLKNTILPHLVKQKKNKVLSIWSAGCSSGEEPYTISMILKDYLGVQAAAWDTRVLATDISQKVLGQAQNAIYEAESLEKVPDRWRTEYFKKLADGRYAVAPHIKSNVIFRTFNLMSPIQFKIKFDVIFCRNVMIYFDQPTKDALVNRFYNATNPGGYLLIGHSESLNKERLAYKYIMPATYQKL